MTVVVISDNWFRSWALNEFIYMSNSGMPVTLWKMPWVLICLPYPRREVSSSLTVKQY